MRQPMLSIRALTALALAAGLVAAQIETHDAPVLATAATEVTISVEARHAGQAAHCEALSQEIRPACAVCLLRTEVRGQVPPRPLVASAPPIAPLALDGAGWLPTQRSDRRSPSRAPPSA